MSPLENSLVDLLVFQLHQQLHTSTLGDVLRSASYSLKQRRFQDLGYSGHQVQLSDLQRMGELLDPHATTELSQYRACLSISLTIALIAEASLIPCPITIGVSHDGSKVHSHAWVTLPDGKLIDTGFQSHRYKAICSFRLQEVA
jgi:hypothetical protein